MLISMLKISPQKSGILTTDTLVPIHRMDRHITVAHEKYQARLAEDGFHRICHPSISLICRTAYLDDGGFISSGFSIKKPITPKQVVIPNASLLV
jgi:hypothetical protein